MAVALWLASIEVPAGMDLIFLSDQMPPRIDDDAGFEERAAYGDMETQGLRGAVADAGYGLGDIVKFTGSLLGQPALGGRRDLGGFGRTSRRFTGRAEQPHLHARTRIQVVRLMNPASSAEIKVVAARPARHLASEGA